MRLGVVTGLQREADCLSAFAGTEQVIVCCRGAGPKAAAAAANELLSCSCNALLSFGLAGGIAPFLQPGDLVIADEVISESGEVWPTDPMWRQSLERRLETAPLHRQPHCLRLAAVEHPLLTPCAKAACGERLTASAVDMESLAVALAAADRRLPFLAIRVIIDPSHQSVPQWLADTLDSGGRPRLTRLLAGLVAHPKDLPALLRLGRSERRAMAALRSVAIDAGPLFALS